MMHPYSENVKNNVENKTENSIENSSIEKNINNSTQNKEEMKFLQTIKKPNSAADISYKIFKLILLFMLFIFGVFVALLIYKFLFFLLVKINVLQFIVITTSLGIGILLGTFILDYFLGIDIKKIFKGNTKKYMNDIKEMKNNIFNKKK